MVDYKRALRRLRIRYKDNFYYLIFLIILIIFTTSLFISNKYVRDSRQCFLFNKDQLEQLEKNIDDYKLLDDIFEAKVQPRPEESIFFIDTTCHTPHKDRNKISDIFRGNLKPLHKNVGAKLTVRQACSVESAALHNPDRDIFILFTSFVYQSAASDVRLLDALLCYPNVHFRFVDLWKLAKNTPVHDWFLKGKLFTSKYSVQHTSDLFRLLLLWKWGGIYLDTDMIIFRSLTDMPLNFLCAESNDTIGSSVLSFSTEGIGHKILEQILDDFQNKYNPNEWEHNGPELLTRVMKELYSVTTISEILDKKQKKEFQVLRPNAFFPITPKQFEEIFDADSTLNSMNESYGIHLWNRYSKSYQLGQDNLKSPYNKIAAKNCPQVYSMVNGFY